MRLKKPVTSTESILLEKETTELVTNDLIEDETIVANNGLFRLPVDMFANGTLSTQCQDDSLVFQYTETQSINNIDTIHSKKYKITLSQARRRALNTIKRAKEKNSVL